MAGWERVRQRYGQWGNAPAAHNSLTYPKTRSRLTQNMEYRLAADQPYCTLILAARITLPHFSISSAMSLPKSAGEPPSTVPPTSANRSFVLGSASTALISLLSLLMIAAGVFLGVPMPCQTCAS